MKKLFLLLTLLCIQFLAAQEKSGAAQFWENLKKHCGKSYEGTLTSAPANDDFAGKKLVLNIKVLSIDCINNKTVVLFDQLFSK